MILWICALGVVFLAWQYFSVVQSAIFSALPYTQAVAFAAIGVVGLLYKDKYTHPLAARVALCMFILFGTLMAINIYRDRAAAQQAKKETTTAFTGVNERITDMQTDLKGRANKADTSLNTISGDLKEFKDKVRPDELNSEMAELHDSLNAVIHPPKANLGFTFMPFFNPPIQDPRPARLVKEISRAMNENRVVSFAIGAVNLSEVAATSVDTALILCDTCTFAKEPIGFTKLNGDADNTRHLKVGVLHPKSTTPNFDIEVNVPLGVRALTVSFGYRCAACIVSETVDMGTVFITNPD